MVSPEVVQHLQRVRLYRVCYNTAMDKTCKINSCEKKFYGNGYCSMHYNRVRRYGSPDVNKRNGKSKHELFGVWASMIDRCRREKHPKYHRYGGRGIKVCDRWSGWHGFDNFIQDMGDRPIGKVRYTLERVDNDKGYSPDNCKWATYKEQNVNRSNIGRPITSRKHGTTNMYKYCRCELCRKAQSDYCKMNRARSS